MALMSKWCLRHVRYEKNRNIIADTYVTLSQHNEE